MAARRPDARAGLHIGSRALTTTKPEVQLTPPSQPLLACRLHQAPRHPAGGGTASEEAAEATAGAGSSGYLTLRDRLSASRGAHSRRYAPSRADRHGCPRRTELGDQRAATDAIGRDISHAGHVTARARQLLAFSARSRVRPGALPPLPAFTAIVRESGGWRTHGEAAQDLGAVAAGGGVVAWDGRSAVPGDVPPGEGVEPSCQFLCSWGSGHNKSLRAAMRMPRLWFIGRTRTAPAGRWPMALPSWSGQ